MGSVSDAMRKRQAEEAARAAAKSDSKPAEGQAGPAGSAAAPAGAAPSAPASAGPVQAAMKAHKAPDHSFVAPTRLVEPTSHNGYSPLLMVHHDRGGAIAEEYRALRTHLLTESGDRSFCYIVTSADRNEGKTLTTFNLGLVMAERQDRRTLVVDCDLRKGRLAGLIKAPRSPGMVELLRGQAALIDVIRPTVYPNLFLIPAGEVSTADIGELVTRPELAELVAQFRRDYDYVLVDTAPVNVVAETAMIGRVVGDALVIVRMNRTPRETTHHAIRLLRAAGVKVDGLVLTHRKYHAARYLYRYQYG